MKMYEKLLSGENENGGGENENTDHWVTTPLIPQSGRRRLWVLAYAPLSGEQKWCVFEVKEGRAGGSRGFKSACAQDKDKMRNYKCDRS